MSKYVFPKCKLNLIKHLSVVTSQQKKTHGNIFLLEFIKINKNKFKLTGGQRTAKNPKPQQCPLLDPITD